MSSVPRLFADDTAALMNADSVQNLQIKINKELDRILNRMFINKLSINSQKSHAFIINPSFSEDQSLFNDHIKLVKSKLSRAVGLLFKLKHVMPTYVLQQMYYAIFFHPHLLYRLYLGCYVQVLP